MATLDRIRDIDPPHILVCDHRGAGLERSVGPLREGGYEVELAAAPTESRERLARRPPDLVVLDPLVRSAGLELADLLAGLPPEASPPILLVAEPGDPAAALAASAALEGLVHGIVRRDASPDELRWHVARLLDESARTRELAELRYRASHDDLTDLLRPRVFAERLEEHASAAGRHGLELALVLIDLDEFGQVNKRFDHTVGDRLLSHVAHVIRRNLRSEDVAGRIGGDEFAIVLPFTGPLQAAATVRRLCTTIRALSGSVEGVPLPLEVSASIGFETTVGDEVAPVDSLRAHAELALRRAKRAGGDRGVYYRSRG
jgi:diguanylate cyclase (GGDEF)-like protein